MTAAPTPSITAATLTAIAMVVPAETTDEVDVEALA